LTNCPLSREDIAAAEDMFGPNLGSLQGKTVQRNGTTINVAPRFVPPEIMEWHGYVTLAMDIMFVNKLAFLVIISIGIKFGTVEYIASRSHETILAGIIPIKNLYVKRGFIVTDCKANLEFAPLKDDLSAEGIDLHPVAEDKHIPEIERQIRTIKERTRCVYNSLPFTKVPARMLIEMVMASMFWLNMFPPIDGVSDKLSSRAIVTGMTFDYNAHCHVEFGAYVQTHKEHDNTM